MRVKIHLPSYMVPVNSPRGRRHQDSAVGVWLPLRGHGRV